MALSDLTADYQQRSVHAADSLDRIVAQRQRDALLKVSGRPTDRRNRPSQWRHVPLDELFNNQGNRVYRRSDGRLETGHEPFHGSKSRRCVLIDLSTGRWWCRSCGRRGDAATLVQELHGWRYSQAAAWLTERYGPPINDGSTRRVARKWIEVRL